MLPDSTELAAWMDDSECVVEATGTDEAIAEISEQLAWIGSALRFPEHGHQIVHCWPNIHIEKMPRRSLAATSIPKLSCRIDFTIEKLAKQPQNSNGQCWHDLFRHAVIVKGYPITRRHTLGIGLEIPLDIMAGLARTPRINSFNGGLYAKGFSTMLVPTKYDGDLLVWHLIYNQDGSHISYFEDTVSCVKNVNIFDLDRARHIVGWCSDVKYLAGKTNQK